MEGLCSGSVIISLKASGLQEEIMTVPGSDRYMPLPASSNKLGITPETFKRIAGAQGDGFGIKSLPGMPDA